MFPNFDLSNFPFYRLNWPQSWEKKENCSEKGERFKKLCLDMKILFLVVTTNTALPARILSLTVTNLITTQSQRITLTLKLCKETIWTKTIDKNQSKMSFSIILFLKGGKINEPWNKHMYQLLQKLNSAHNWRNKQQSQVIGKQVCHWRYILVSEKLYKIWAHWKT